MASLDAQVSNIDAAKISRELNNWKALTPFLDLTPQQETEIEKSSGDYGEQKRAALLKWKEVKGEKATYRALIAAATEAVIANLADYVRGLIAADGGGIANDGGGASETELTTDDMIKVATYLSSLSKEEVKTLGMVLGLSDTTVRNNYDGSSASSYLDSILRAWFGKKDKVTQNGGPKWSVLVTALRHRLLGHNGIADDIHSERQI